jgi:hypothetical protein
MSAQACWHSGLRNLTHFLPSFVPRAATRTIPMKNSSTAKK